MSESLELKVGQLQGRMSALEEDVRDIKESTKEISDALTKGKGVFIGLIIAAASGGAFLSEIFKKWMN